MVIELMADGMRQPEIAAAVEASQPTISRINKKGQVPDYPLGKRIEAVYFERFGDKAA